MITVAKHDYISDYTIPGYPLRRASQTVQKFFEVTTLYLYCRREKIIKGGNKVELRIQGIEFKSELFHPTKIKIELTSFENFENELFTIFIKNFNTLELTLGTEVNSIVQFVQKHHISILMETATMT